MASFLSRLHSAVQIATPLTIGSEFGWVTLAATAIAVQVVLEGQPIMALRRELKVNYPDMGAGRDAAKLNDKDYERFNNAMRAHYNYVEGAASILTLLLVSGVFYPRYSAALAAVYVVGRHFYSQGYRAKGAKGRSPGVILVDGALVGLLGSAIAGSLALIGYL